MTPEDYWRGWRWYGALYGLWQLLQLALLVGIALGIWRRRR